MPPRVALRLLLQAHDATDSASNLAALGGSDSGAAPAPAAAAPAGAAHHDEASQHVRDTIVMSLGVASILLALFILAYMMRHSRACSCCISVLLPLSWRTPGPDPGRDARQRAAAAAAAKPPPVVVIMPDCQEGAGGEAEEKQWKQKVSVGRARRSSAEQWLHAFSVVDEEGPQQAQHGTEGLDMRVPGLDSSSS